MLKENVICTLAFLSHTKQYEVIKDTSSFPLMSECPKRKEEICKKKKKYVWHMQQFRGSCEEECR
jgi:hypothetical protein